MKRLTQIFQALLGVVALIITAIVAFGRLAWRTIRRWWRERAGWVWRTVVGCCVAFVVGFVAMAAYAIYEDEYGRDYWDRKLSRGITLRSFADNKWRIYDHKSGEYTTEKINWLSDVAEGDSLAVYAVPNRRGYINIKTGRVVVDAEKHDYRKAWVFSEGLAAVMQGDKVGFINPQNEVVIPFQFEGTDACRMCDFGYAFHGGLCAVPAANGDLGLIDRTGHWVVDATYDEIWAPQTNGFRVVVDGGSYGLLDAAGCVAYPTEYDHISILEHGLVFVRDGRMWQTDFEGNTTHPFLFEYASDLYYPLSLDEEELVVRALSDYACYTVCCRYGILNRLTGKPITPAIYSEIEMLSEGLFQVQEADGEAYYLLDHHGQSVEE